MALVERLGAKFPRERIYRSKMTPAIGTHTGHGLLLVAIPGDKGQFRLAGKTTRSIKIARIDFGDRDCRPSAIMGHKRGQRNRTVGGGWRKLRMR